MINFLVWIIGCSWLWSNLTWATNVNDTSNGVREETLLFERLKNSLPKYSPPQDMTNNSVYIFIDLYQIANVDEKDGFITAKLWLYYYYYSQSARWNSTEYNKPELFVPPGTFWSADISKIKNYSNL